MIAVTEAAPAQPHHPQLAVSAAIFRDGRLLLVRRARAPAKGLYSLPGGRVEYGETLEQAVAREVAEETGLSIEIVGFAGRREVLPSAASAAGHYVIMMFAARWTAGEPRLNDELDDARWIAPDELSDFPTTEGLAELVAGARPLIDR
ncbi:ADP-ribose pyrophosphatase YjhB (NUDIX family) [Rhodopseudomonas thermotolerans]|uniref:ADP-ribose pyrophosphatase YjhB (NUDIX family) n=2 Tax=Rhodopseudomonas TaxID=1073 RepID=A0A336JL49_9BRAD|nr:MULTISPECIES: NUDIX hydrolase [Rhodopseudomonas]RED37453.1 ADP-ribose pyrophosphatase YjhB (NUDIX family) [Rhodopseudomonas pentothenatexigens]REG03940.1 ADP-ribose pyrophosphatase YjhB (NUDIX family) [Rhodopseudomonas thermotolerans]SSW90420.1 ADP-ribose pyrophosphatase YjhB (NUDIX family) [Rhodopseudomonas pentothenatexigens]